MLARGKVYTTRTTRNVIFIWGLVFLLLASLFPFLHKENKNIIIDFYYYITIAAFVFLCSMIYHIQLIKRKKELKNTLVSILVNLHELSDHELMIDHIKNFEDSLK